mmetsp:Transcript_34007/g.68627  ORF Transcript_34007/g.68627 Transcript_34007/m.68627 type:complete len:206 (+) Transcript_34007:261-878(+)
MSRKRRHLLHTRGVNDADKAALPLGAALVQEHPQGILDGQRLGRCVLPLGTSIDPAGCHRAGCSVGFRCRLLSPLPLLLEVLHLPCDGLQRLPRAPEDLRVMPRLLRKLVRELGQEAGDLLLNLFDRPGGRGVGARCLVQHLIHGMVDFVHLLREGLDEDESWGILCRRLLQLFLDPVKLFGLLREAGVGRHLVLRGMPFPTSDF